MRLSRSGQDENFAASRKLHELLLDAHRRRLQAAGPYFEESTVFGSRILAASDEMAVTLLRGNLFSATGPLVGVATMHDPTGVMLSVDAVMAEERRRLIDHAGLTAPPGVPVTFPASIDVDGKSIPVVIQHDGVLWGGSLWYGTGRSRRCIAVFGRGVAIDAVRLRAIETVDRYWSGAEELNRTLASEEWPHQHEGDVVASATMLESFRRLLEVVLIVAEEAEVGAAVEVQDAARLFQDRWQEAVRMLQEAVEFRQLDAERVASRIIDHLAALARDATWMTASQARRATQDVISYNSSNAPVSSSRAQQAWSELMDARTATARVIHAASLDEAGATLARLREGWRSAWLEWARAATDAT